MKISKIFRGAMSVVLAGALASVLSLPASAQDFPTQPIKLTVGFGPGGVSDVIMRIAAEGMTAHLGQPVVVENRPGAGGLIAATAVKNAQPDGYSLIGGALTTVTPTFFKENHILASQDLAPVALVSVGAFFVFVRSDLNIASLAQLADYAKAKPGQLKLAAPSGANIALAALIANRLGFEYKLIPYKTTDETVLSLLRGDADFAVTQLSGFMPQLQAGAIKAVASLGSARTELMPDVPTAIEQGAQVEILPSQGIWAPKGTPRDVLDKLSAAVQAALNDPAAKEKLRGVSAVAKGSTPDELVKQFESENAVYAEAMKIAGLQPN